MELADQQINLLTVLKHIKYSSRLLKKNEERKEINTKLFFMV